MDRRVCKCPRTIPGPWYSWDVWTKGSTSIGCVTGLSRDCSQSLVLLGCLCTGSGRQLLAVSRDAWTVGSTSIGCVLGLSGTSGMLVQNGPQVLALSQDYPVYNTPRMLEQRDLQALAVSQDYPGIVYSPWYSRDVCVQGGVYKYWLCPGIVHSPWYTCDAWQRGLQGLAVSQDCHFLYYFIET